MTYEQILTIVNECTSGTRVAGNVFRVAGKSRWLVMLNIGDSKYEKYFHDAVLDAHGDDAELHIRSCVTLAVRAVCEGE